MDQPPYDILTIADACIDLVVDLGETLPRFGQEEQWISGYAADLGGSGCLFACQAAKLGLRVAILGRVGDDLFGHHVIRCLGQSGVDTRYLKVDPEVRTGLGLHLVRNRDDRAILTFAGSISAVYPEDVDEEWLRRGRHLHYCSYFLQTNLLPAAPALLRRAKELGLTVSLDTNWDPSASWEKGVPDAVRLADVFLPNAQEALAISRTRSASEALATLVRWGPEVVIKLGSQGALVWKGGDPLLVPVEPVALFVDSIGAGDSFDAGYVAAWLQGRPPEECAKVGNACGRRTLVVAGGLQGQPRAAEVWPGPGRIP